MKQVRLPIPPPGQVLVCCLQRLLRASACLLRVRRASKKFVLQISEEFDSSNKISSMTTSPAQFVSLMSEIIGTVQGHRDGHGFVVSDDGESSIYLPSQEMRSVLHRTHLLRWK